MKHFVTAAAVATLWAGSAWGQGTPIVMALKDPAGAEIGSVTVTGAPGGVLLRVEAKGLQAGWHGMHIHAVGSCEGPKFESAGGHVHEGPAAKHGLLNADRTDTGDLPNIHAGADGLGSAEVFSTLVRLDRSDGDAPALRDKDGAALIIHASPDDYTSQPIGGTGARIACAVIK